MKTHLSVLLKAGVLMLMSSAMMVHADDIISDNPLELIGSKIDFKGTVVKKSCDLDLASEKQTIRFLDVDIKTLLQNGHSYKTPFEVTLSNCDISILSEVSVMFSGSEDTELPGRIKVSGAKDVAIALFADAKPNQVLALNEATDGQTLSSGHNVLRFKARVEAHPSALQKKDIETGAFQAIANFTLEYK